MKRQKKSHKSPKPKNKEEQKLHTLSGFGHYEVISPSHGFGGRAVMEIPSLKNIPEKDDYTWWWYDYCKKIQETIEDTEEEACRDYQE